MNIAEIRVDLEKKKITRYILEALPEWFGLSDSREEYIRDSEGKLFFCAYSNEEPVGFLYLKETGKDTVELAVMGVLKEYHRKGIGKALFECAKKVICEKGYLYIIDEPVTVGTDICQHPRTTMDENAEFLAKRLLKVKMICELPLPFDGNLFG